MMTPRMQWRMIGTNRGGVVGLVLPLNRQGICYISVIAVVVFVVVLVQLLLSLQPFLLPWV